VLPTLTVSYSGFVNGDTSASLAVPPTLSTTATPASHVGTYRIRVSEAADPDYAVTFVDGTLAVTPAALTITADDQAKVYGAAVPTLTVRYEGFVNGDTSAVVSGLAVSTTVTAASHVGDYPVTAAGAVAADYTIAYVAGTLHVTPAPLTITADNKSTVYGAAPPPLTASYAGLVNGDTPASLTAPPTLSTPPPPAVRPALTPSRSAGPSHPITPSPLSTARSPCSRPTRPSPGPAPCPSCRARRWTVPS
jgi:hypothetical protein